MNLWHVCCIIIITGCKSFIDASFHKYIMTETAIKNVDFQGRLQVHDKNMSDAANIAGNQTDVLHMCTFCKHILE